MQYSLASLIYINECEKLFCSFITLFYNSDLTMREMFPVM